MTFHGPEVMMSLVPRRTGDHNLSFTVKNQRNDRQSLQKVRDVASPPLERVEKKGTRQIMLS